MLCIDPDSDSDIIIEEGETDLKAQCLIMKEEKKDHESGEEGDDEQSEQPMETTVEQESMLHKSLKKRLMWMKPYLVHRHRTLTEM